MIKVKGTPTRQSNGKSVCVTLETPEGKEYERFAKLEHVLDEGIFKSLLQTWDRQIKEEEARVELTKEDVEKVLKKRAKMEIKD